MKALDKRLSFSDLWAFNECPQQFLWRRQRVRGEFTVHQAVGNVVHKLAAEGDSEAAREYATRQLARFTPGEQAEANQRIEALAQANEEMSGEDTSCDRKPEKLVIWKDPISGWELVAKPDEVSVTQGRKGLDLLQVTDIKTGGRLKKKHKEQIYFFGMVVSLARDYHGPVKLVVRLLGSRASQSTALPSSHVPGEEVLWYSPHLTGKQLDKVRRVIQGIEACEEKDNFPATPEWRACNGCKFRQRCPAFQALFIPRFSPPQTGDSQPPDLEKTA